MSRVMFQDIYAKVPNLGEYFRGAEIGDSNLGRLLPSADLERAYPDDDSVGAKWIETGDYL